MTPRRRVLGLEWNVFFTGLVSFFMDVSSEMVYPLVPLFLASVLGVNKSVIGLIEGIAETTASMVKLFSGWLSDRLGRRKALMEAGYGISAISRVGLALAGTWGMVLAVRFVDRFGKGIRTAPRDAIIADASTSADLSRNFGFHRAMDQFGAVLGPGIAFLVLAAKPGAYRTVFWLSVIPGMIAVLRHRPLHPGAAGAAEGARGRLPAGPRAARQTVPRAAWRISFAQSGAAAADPARAPSQLRADHRAVLAGQLLRRLPHPAGPESWGGRRPHPDHVSRVQPGLLGALRYRRGCWPTASGAGAWRWSATWSSRWRMR